MVDLAAVVSALYEFLFYIWNCVRLKKASYNMCMVTDLNFGFVVTRLLFPPEAESFQP